MDDSNNGEDSGSYMEEDSEGMNLIIFEEISHTKSGGKKRLKNVRNKLN